MRYKLLIILLTLTLTGCAGVDLTQYRNEKPVFVLEDYFNGDVEAWGIVQNFKGEVVKRFKVSINAAWDSGRGVIDEKFVFSDGTRQTRIWTINKEADGNYTGTADDVVGVARGRAEGNALQWAYTLNLPVDDKIYQVYLDDWMFLMDDSVLVNRTTMKKFGIALGEITIFFRKKS